MTRTAVCYEKLFVGQISPPTTADSGDWVKADTSAAGSPTVIGTSNGLTITLAATNEVENVCLYHGDVLSFDIDDLIRAEFWVSMPVALGAAGSVAFGLASARNDAIDSITAHASFRCIGSSAILCESDDGTNDKDDIATGQTLATTLKKFVIDFSEGTSDVRFLCGDANNNLIRVAKGTTFNMSNYTSGLQPYVQLQKTAATEVPSVALKYLKIESRI